jgi:hypothetical protein
VSGPVHLQVVRAKSGGPVPFLLGTSDNQGGCQLLDNQIGELPTKQQSDAHRSFDRAGSVDIKATGFSSLEPMTGTPSQLEWADRIRPRVDAEFSRVANAFHDVASRQSEHDRIDTLAVIGILEEKRIEELAHREAGYFIKHWVELSDQVRQTIFRDPRYKAIQAKRGNA